MAFSYLAIIHSDITKDIYSLGVTLANTARIEIVKSYNNGCRAIIHLDADYPVTIGFSRIGAPNYSCECATYSYDCICEHITAVAIAYDHSRGVFFDAISE